MLGWSAPLQKTFNEFSDPAPVKIACISASRVPSSAANSIQVMKACQAIHELGHEVHLYVPGEAQQATNTDIKVFYGLRSPFSIEWLPSRPGLHRYDLAWQAVHKAAHIEADLTYVWFIQAGIFSLLRHLPVLYELHGPPEGSFGPTLFRTFLKLPGKKRLLPITHALASQLSQSYPVKVTDPELVKVLPNGVDLERYINLPQPSQARLQLGLPTKFSIGYTGHLYPGRGISLLLELARRFPQLHFLWVGGVEADQAYWRRRLTESDIENVTLAGFIDNQQLPLYQAACEILLMPYEKVISGSSGGNSAAYASPMKMFEYMASRRAIISSDLPVIREVLNQSNAVFCPPDDIEGWSRALSALVTDDERRCSLAEQAWKDAQQYSWLERARSALQGFPQPQTLSAHD